MISVSSLAPPTREGRVTVLISDARGLEDLCCRACAISAPAALCGLPGGPITLWLQVAWEARPCSGKPRAKDRCSAPDSSGLRGTRKRLSPDPGVTSRSPLSYKQEKTALANVASEQTRSPCEGLESSVFSGLLTCGHREPIIRTADHLWTRGPRNFNHLQLLNSRGPPPSNQGLMRPTFCY